MIDWRILAGGVAAVAVVATAYGLGYRSAHNAVSYDWEKDKLSHANAIIAKEREYRDREHQWAESLRGIIDWHTEQREGVEREYESIVADLESGALRLRDDLRGCRNRVPEDATASKGDHGAGQGGLSPERQRVALRLWREADEVALRLQAAQRYIAEVCQG